jgi:hypothetical protein
MRKRLGRGSWNLRGIVCSDEDAATMGQAGHPAVCRQTPERPAGQRPAGVLTQSSKSAVKPTLKLPLVTVNGVSEVPPEAKHVPDPENVPVALVDVIAVMFTVPVTRVQMWL